MYCHPPLDACRWNQQEESKHVDDSSANAYVHCQKLVCHMYIKPAESFTGREQTIFWPVELLVDVGLADCLPSVHYLAHVSRRKRLFNTRAHQFKPHAKTKHFKRNKMCSNYCTVHLKVLRNSFLVGSEAKLPTQRSAPYLFCASVGKISLVSIGHDANKLNSGRVRLDRGICLRL